MALGVGTKLGPYEILSPAGVGGMGEVYRPQPRLLILNAPGPGGAGRD